MRVLLNYSHAFIEGGPLAAAVEARLRPSRSTSANMASTSVQARFQIDF